MPLSPSRWRRVSESEFPWEREALQFLADHLPNQEPVRMWSNFEFISNDGHINEVDALILTAKGLFLVEIKSRPARRLTGDAFAWSWTDGARTIETDNPLFLTDHKAKRLRSLLAPFERKEGVRLPFIETLVFCSAAGLEIRLPANIATRVYGLGRTGGDGAIKTPGIVQALMDAEVGPRRSERLIDASLAGALVRALDKGGVCRGRSARRINGYKLDQRLAEGPLYQDYLATHPSLKVTRRVRLYPYPPGASQERRETIRRAAEREFRALEQLTHASLLKPLEFQDSEFGPSLLFEFDPGAVRLDYFLRSRHATLTLEARVHLIREVAEAIRFAHDNRRIHRALSPQCILIRNPDAPQPTVQVMNWHTGSYSGDATTGVPSVLGPTSHMSDLVDEGQAVYLAPEASHAGELTEAADVFSLGAVAYFVLTGQPPARTPLDLAERLRRGGLLLSDVIDAPNQVLLEMVRDATAGTLGNRSDLEDVLAGLDLWEESITAPDLTPRLNPADATAGDELPGGYTVERRLGKGSTALALLVRHQNERLVLKVALGTEFNERVREEGDILKKLHHPRIVGLREIRDMEPVTALALEYAGDRTLGKILRDDGRLSLEFLQRFGDDLLDALDYLEQQGIWHRDIKPDNIGVAPYGRGDQLRLTLYDFSLSRTPLDQVRAGTPGYLDPFIPLRQPPRYDLQAERFAAAVTLYEMATGKLPTWGDGSDPAQLDCEATVDTDAMDAPVREGLAAFFRRALARDIAGRFDNAADMREAWRKALATVQPGKPETTLPEDTGPLVFDPTLVEAATLETSIDDLGLSMRGVNALERLGCATLRDMLTRPIADVFAMRGVGNKTRRELRQAYEIYQKRFAGADLSAATTRDDQDHDRAPVETLFARLLTAKEKEPGNPAAILCHLLGLDGDVRSMPSQVDVATRVGVTRAYVSLVLQRPKNRWAKDAAITALRRELADLITASGGVMGISELTTAILERRGRLEAGEAGEAGERRAVAVLRAAMEAEDTLKEPRFALQRRDGRALVASTTGVAAYAFALGQKADTLAQGDLLLPAARVVQELREVPAPAGVALEDGRMVRVAVVASAGAAMSSRQEIYPRGMSAARAAKLCATLAPSVGADGRSEAFTVEQVRRRIEGRFPEAELLPDRPELDRLLADADWNVRWDPAALDGDGAYCAHVKPVFSTSDGTISWRPTVLAGTALPVDEDALAARRFDERLRAAAQHGGFLVLTVPEKYYVRAEQQLARQYGVHPINLDRALITAMKDVAATGKVRWDIVLKADAERGNARTWQNLQNVVRKALTKVGEAIPRTAPPALVTSPGLLQRYGQWPWLSDLAQRAGRTDGVHGVWLLVPWEDPSTPPAMNGEAIPMLPSQRAHIPDGWLGNRHRAA